MSTPYLTRSNQAEGSGEAQSERITCAIRTAPFGPIYIERIWKVI
ncbi:hypothetical protein [Luteimonas fraxinea]|jgi:hypothetical protein|nr:hypothetical protein [Luteimonas fraxinea]